MYQSPREQWADPEWRDEHPDLAKMDVPLYHYLIEDFAVKYSWVGQQTAAIERAWTARGGRRLSSARKASAVGSIVALDFGRLSFVDL